MSKCGGCLAAVVFLSVWSRMDTPVRVFRLNSGHPDLFSSDSVKVMSTGHPEAFVCQVKSLEACLGNV